MSFTSVSRFCLASVILMAFSSGGCGILDGTPGDSEPIALSFDFRDGLQG